MAKLVTYEVPPAPQPGAREEWETLVETLHRSGTLRFLNGLFGRLGPVSEVALDGLNTEKGRNLVGLVLAAGQVGSHISADSTEQVASGAAQAVSSGTDRTTAPSWWKLVRLLFAADTRRAIGNMLLILNRAGAAMRKPVPNQPRH